jgi:hypothetical protein
MTTVYVIRRTDKEDPTDTDLIFGAPGDMGNGYPVNHTFVTSDSRLAHRYCCEMVARWGEKNTYAIEEREVHV